MDFSKQHATWWSGTCYHREQLDAIISSTDVRTYAWILHDKDRQEDGNGLSKAQNDGRKSGGEFNGECNNAQSGGQKGGEAYKKPHFHFLVQFVRNQRGAWFKAFSTDDMGIVFARPSYAPQGAYDYLIHDTPSARKEGKHLYDPSERISTIENLDPDEKEVDENAELYAELLELLDNKITWHEMLKRKPKRIHMVANIKTAFDLLFKERYGTDTAATAGKTFGKGDGFESAATIEKPFKNKYRLDETPTTKKTPSNPQTPYISQNPPTPKNKEVRASQCNIPGLRRLSDKEATKLGF